MLICLQHITDMHLLRRSFRPPAHTVNDMIGENVTTIEVSLPSKLGYEKVARHMLEWLD